MHAYLQYTIFLYIKYLKSRDAIRGEKEVEGSPNQSTKHFPFSKPSPFSSMTDGSLGQPTNDDRPLQKTHTSQQKRQNKS